jgi:hypothetical protein
MANALRELLASFGIAVDTKSLDKAQTKVSTFEGALSGLATKLVGVFAIRALGQFAASTIETTAHLDDTAQQLGVTTEQLQRFQYAAKLSGVSEDDASTSLKFLNKHLGEAASGAGTGADDFAALGVSVRDASGNMRPAVDLLPDMANGFQRLGTDGERTALAMKLFGRGGAALIPLLKQGGAGVSKLSAEFDALGGGLSGASVKAMADADDQLDRLKFSGRLLSTELIAALVPGLTKVVGWVTQGIGVFREFAKSSDSVQRVLEIVAVIAGVALAVWALFNIEVIVAVAIFALLVLAAEDLWKTFDGGDTITRRLIDRLLGVGATQTIVDGLKSSFDSISTSIGTASAATDSIKAAIERLGAAMGITFGDDTIDVLSLVTDELKGQAIIVEAIAKNFESAANHAADLINGITSAGQKLGILDASPTGQGSTGGAARGAAFVPRSQVGGGAASHTANVSNQTEVNNNFYGPADPNKVKDATREGVKQGHTYSAAFAAVPGSG